MGKKGNIRTTYFEFTLNTFIVNTINKFTETTTWQ
jgi:hypothetical protein